MIVERHKSDSPFPGGKAAPALAPVRFESKPIREVSILDLLLALGPYRRLILLITVAFGILGLAAAWIVRPSFTSHTIILPPRQNASLAANMASELSNLGVMSGLVNSGLGIKNEVDLYAALLKSDTIADSLIKEFNLQHEYKAKYLSQARKALAKHTTIKTDLKSNLISIAFTDHDPHRAAAIANAYVEQYRQLSQTLAITEAGQRRAFFQRQMLQAKGDLENAEEALVATEQKTGLVALDSQERAQIQSAAMLRAQITVKQAEIQSMQAYATPQNAQLIEAQRSLASLQDELNKMGAGGVTVGREFSIPQAKVPKEGMEYVRRLRDVKYYNTIFDILARQFEAAKLDEAREGQLVQVVDPALVPDRKSSPNRILWTIVALLIGFVISLVIASTLAAVRWMRLDPDTDRKMSDVRRMWLSRAPPGPKGPR